MNGGAGETFLPYLNLTHGMRMDYAASWMMREQATPVSFGVSFGSPQESPADQFQEILTISVQPLFEGTTLAAIVQNWQAMAQQAGVAVVESGMMMMGTQSALRVVFTTMLDGGQMPGRVLMYLFVVANKGYTVMYTGQEGHFEVFLPVVNQMLSTLQVH